MDSTSASTFAIDLALAQPGPGATAHTPGHGPTTCLNCGTPVPERFCGHCGQDAHHTHRLNLAHMLHEIPHSIWHVDKGIQYSLWNVLTRPGPTIRSYLAGQRKYHFPPLSLLLLVTGTFAFVSAVLHIDMMPPRDPAMPEAMWQMQKDVTSFMAKYMSWVYVALVPVIAAFARLFLRRGGYNYAECLVIAAFITAVCNFLTLLSLPIIYFYSGTAQVQQVTYLVSAISLGYATWAYGSMLAHTGLGLVGRLLRGFFPFVLGVFLPSMLAGMLAVGLNWDAFKKNAQEQQRLQQQQAKPAVPAH
ncbi:DUF3667 domain-containing protein [Hymenobacter chitinivorans]|uniref:Uncharacterized protein DUF3667 n=1 Tax=Hymenobacter chitinivorans DSM 11115 TaxID=1121954 RepID=A0A2M9BTD9_9BACT|nr:DUF3667 domain-containing protein [Hymenobacter chitinivorans]PJJ61197.1 uncharacterized protein DUF3667 [Hymenobacter chitinivorans DSM 11115]